MGEMGCFFFASHIRNNPEIFSRIHLVAPPELRWPDLGLTLDEKSDYELIKSLIEFFSKVKPMFSCLDAVSHLRNHPELVEMNRKVVRKGNT